MDSDKTYEESLAELRHIRKQLTYDTISIDVSKLDGKSKEAIIYALSAAAADREKQIINLISGVK